MREQLRINHLQPKNSTFQTKYFNTFDTNWILEITLDLTETVLYFK